jgi:hypothetical protein
MSVDAQIREDANQIERLLDETAEQLRYLPKGRLRRELCLRVETCRRAVAEWANRKPTPLQRVILLDCVNVLRARAFVEAPETPKPK